MGRPKLFRVLGGWLGAAACFTAGWWAQPTVWPRRSAPNHDETAGRSSPAVNAEATAQTAAGEFRAQLKLAAPLDRHALQTRLARATNEECAALAATLGEIPRSSDRRWMQTTLLRRWSALTPEAAFVWASAEQRGDDRDRLVHFAILGWGRHDLAAATAAALRFDARDERKWAVDSLARLLGEEDPERFPGWLAQLPDARLQEKARQGFIRSLAVADPRAALDFARQNPKTDFGFWAIDEAFRTFGERDSTAAMQFAAANPEYAVRLVEALSGDRALAVKYVLSFPGGMLRQRANAAVHLLHRLPLEEVTLVRDELLSGMNDEYDRRVVVATWFTVATRDNPSAVQTLGAQLPGPEWDDDLGEVAARWAVDEPDAAHAWALQLPESRSRTVIEALIQSIAEDDPRRAVEFVRELPPNTDQGGPGFDFGRLGKKIAEHGAEAVNDAFLRLPAGQSRALFLGAAVEELANLRPDEALVLLQHFPEGEVRDAALEKLVHGWSWTDPAEATAWVMEQAPESRRQDLLEKSIWRWVRSEPVVAYSWIQKLPAGPARETALLEAVTAFGTLDPAGARAWLADLPPGHSRRIAITSLARDWLRIDPAAAAAWLETTELTPTQRERILSGKP